jgi:hypothetical protein
MSLPADVGESVHVESSTRMAWGSSPCRSAPVSCVRMHRRGATYIDEGLLALDADLEGVPADLDVQVLALVLCLDGDGDVEVLDGLVPFVRQRSLLSLLLCAGLGVGLCALFGGRRTSHGVCSYALGAGGDKSLVFRLGVFVYGGAKRRNPGGSSSFSGPGRYCHALHSSIRILVAALAGPDLQLIDVLPPCRGLRYRPPLLITASLLSPALTAMPR